MAGAHGGFKAEWQAFASARPGRRFVAHHHRAQSHSSRFGRVVRVGLGVVLLAAGLVMLVIPGPGLLVSLFGLGLLATMSERLARLLDRVEPRLRAAAHAVHAWWLRRAQPTKLAFGAVAALGAIAAIAFGLWTFFG